MKRLSIVCMGLIAAALLFFSAAATTAQAADLYPTDSIPMGAGELVDVSTFGARADYYICYTFREPGGKLATYVFHVGGPRVTDSDNLDFRLSHILHPMN